MKLKARMFGRIIALALALSQATPAHAADWVNDWFAQSASTAPGGLQTQQRGFYTGGSFQGRWRMTNDYPLSVSPPRMSAGCGGIDLFGGGMSFLDPEYLVQKFERIIQAAPAFAFEMAMQEYCKPCSSAMQTMTEITDYLNSIQINDCRMSKQIAAIPMKGDMSIFSDAKEKVMQGYAIASGQSKNSQGVDDSVRSSGGVAPIDVREIVSDCPDVFREIFTNGSVVQNMATHLGLDSYADLTRGLIGDVTVNYNSSQQAFVVVPIEACPGNDQLDQYDLMQGKLEKKDVSGTCGPSGSQKVTDAVESKLLSITAKMAAGANTPLSTEDAAFIASAPFPLFNLLRDAVATNNVDETIQQVKDPLASAFAYRMLDDLHKMSKLVLTKADEVKNTQTNARSQPLHCDTSYLVEATGRISSMDEKALKYRELAKANYLREQSELLVNLQRAQSMLAQRRQALQDKSGSLK